MAEHASNFIPKGMTVHIDSENGVLGLVGIINGIGSSASCVPSRDRSRDPKRWIPT